MLIHIWPCYFSVDLSRYAFGSGTCPKRNPVSAVRHLLQLPYITRESSRFTEIHRDGWRGAVREMEVRRCLQGLHDSLCIIRPHKLCALGHVDSHRLRYLWRYGQMERSRAGNAGRFAAKDSGYRSSRKFERWRDAGRIRNELARCSESRL